MPPITPKVICQLVDPTAYAHQIDGGWWFITSDVAGQPFFTSDHLADPAAPYESEASAWQAAERFLLSRTPLTAAR